MRRLEARYPGVRREFANLEGQQEAIVHRQAVLGLALVLEPEVRRYLHPVRTPWTNVNKEHAHRGVAKIDELTDKYLQILTDTYLPTNAYRQILDSDKRLGQNEDLPTNTWHASEPSSHRRTHDMQTTYRGTLCLPDGHQDSPTSTRGCRG